MAERLGTGLQNPLHRFESGSDLHPKNTPNGVFFLTEVLKILSLKKEKTP
jgi:hypothetical protein